MITAHSGYYQSGALVFRAGHRNLRDAGFVITGAVETMRSREQIRVTRPGGSFAEFSLAVNASVPFKLGK
jgi:hypothetical protein